MSRLFSCWGCEDSTLTCKVEVLLKDFRSSTVKVRIYCTLNLDFDDSGYCPKGKLHAEYCLRF